ncbi:MAG: hypothetical protein LBD74_01920 [Spirochaetaceae bacterium]|jgi:hypothetical protein|nr:hypothetical protein [Spirochaetaceae bacterium]
MTSEKPWLDPIRNRPETQEATRELDAYGVWVKSEGQNGTEGFPDSLGSFIPAATESPEAESREREGIPTLRFSHPAGEEAAAPYLEAAALAEASPQGTVEGLHLLQKILDELSLIRREVLELKTLVILREEAVTSRDDPLDENEADGAEVSFVEARGTFTGEEDEKVTITGDELTSIFQNPVSLPQVLSPSHAHFAQEIEVTPTVDEPEEGETESLLGEAPPFPQEEVLREEIEVLVPPPDASLEADPEPDTTEGAVASLVKNDFLIDELFIESGSIKDIPLDLTAQDEEDLDEAFERLESLIGPENLPAETAEDDDDPDDPDDGSGQGAFPHKESDEPKTESSDAKPFDLKGEIKNVLMAMDQLLEALPEEKIGEFAESRYFDIYKKLFSELGIA